MNLPLTTFPLHRFGVVGDVHGEADFLQKALEFLRKKGAEHILVTGDVVDGEPHVERCCQLLQSPDVSTIRGNHDRWLVRDEMRTLPDATDKATLSPSCLSFLETLPTSLRLPSIVGTVMLCHGLGDNDMARLLPEHYGIDLENNYELSELLEDPLLALVVSGHSHRPMVRTIKHLMFINAGTLKRDNDPCFVMADLREREVTFYQLDNHGHIWEGDWFPLVVPTT
jgi:predicted phosphodiesterase